MSKYISAYFNDEENLLRASKTLKQKGFDILDILTPFPVHGIDEILEYKTI